MARLGSKLIGMPILAASLALLSDPASSQQAPGAQQQIAVGQGGRWVPRGTFALSMFENNLEREISYAGTANERARVATFLPGMTIVYQSQPSLTRANFQTGMTHSGIPVEVLNAELSTGRFRDRSTQDVVIHRAHSGCRDLECTGDAVTVGIGESFEIVKADEKEVLLRDTDEKQVIYSPTRLADLERRGFLTIHKNRTHPRWKISDGYAAAVSTGCGERLTQVGPLEVTAAEYVTDPATWDLNDDRWSLKAIEIFNLGPVRSDAATGKVSGSLVTAIEGRDDETVAIDLTVFGYRDSGWREGFHKFAGILQIVQCDGGSRIGRLRPRYVKEAIVYFDRREGDDYEQSFPLVDFEMPRQFSEEIQTELSTFLPRSFFYSVNTYSQHEQVFEMISEFIPHPTAVANIIARLNASCSDSDRPRCGILSEPAFE